MSDLFHYEVPRIVLIKVFEKMLANKHHVFFVLTKRAERMANFVNEVKKTCRPEDINHIWFGVSVEDEPRMERLKVLARIEGINRFVSFEPLVGKIQVSEWEKYLLKMDWIICGAETGPKARFISVSTVNDLEEFTNKHRIPFFFKKWGNGIDNGSMPRQFPVFRKAADTVGTNPGGNPHNSLENEPAQVGGTVADGKEGE